MCERTKNENQVQGKDDTVDIDYAKTIVSLVDRNLISLSGLRRINDGHEIDRDDIEGVVFDTITKKKIVPNVYLLLLGYKDAKYVQKLLDLLTVVAERTKVNIEDIFYYMSAHLLFANIDDEAARSLSLSRTLADFAIGRGENETRKLAASINYAVTFMYTIAKFVYGISKKYEHAGMDEKKKVFKLYAPKVRLGMLVASALNIANEELSVTYYASPQLQPALTKFIARHKDLITQKDLFEETYPF